MTQGVAHDGTILIEEPSAHELVEQELALAERSIRHHVRRHINGKVVHCLELWRPQWKTWWPAPLRRAMWAPGLLLRSKTGNLAALQRASAPSGGGRASTRAWKSGRGRFAWASG